MSSFSFSRLGSYLRTAKERVIDLWWNWEDTVLCWPVKIFQGVVIVLWLLFQVCFKIAVVFAAVVSFPVGGAIRGFISSLWDTAQMLVAGTLAVIYGYQPAVDALVDLKLDGTLSWVVTTDVGRAAVAALLAGLGCLTLSLVLKAVSGAFSGFEEGLDAALNVAENINS